MAPSALAFWSAATRRRFGLNTLAKLLECGPTVAALV